MIFELSWEDQALEEYNRIKQAAEDAFQKSRAKDRKKSSRAEGLFKQVYKTIGLLRSNPRHPGLHTHEMDSLSVGRGGTNKVFTAYAQNNTPGAYRVFWEYGPKAGQITIIAITPHP